MEPFSPMKAAEAEKLAEHFRIMNLGIEIPPTERLRVAVSQWMARAVEQVQRNQQRARDNNRLWALDNPQAMKRA